MMFTMKRFYFLIILLVAGGGTAFSQSTNCTQVLSLVRLTYEQGRLHELPQLADACLTAAPGKGFTKEQKREAYRYLTLAYIYLEEPEKADETMLKLLDTDHFYQINLASDPAEFIALYNKFRHEPLFRVGLKFGLNLTQPTALSYYNIGSTAGGMGKYSLSSSFQILALFEKDLTKKLIIAPEVGLVLRGYNYSNSNLLVADDPAVPASVSTQNLIVKQSYLDLNGIVQYKIKSSIQLQTYIGGGPGISYLLSSTDQATTVLGNEFTITGSTVDDTKSFNKLMYSFSVVAGAKLKFGEIYVTGDLRYQIGLSNVINKSSRSNMSLVYDYQAQYNDYRMSNLMLNIGIIYPYFKPKKLIK